MKTLILKRTISLDGHKTTVSLENEFWNGLHDIARHENASLSELVKKIADERTTTNLSSAIRVFVFNYFRMWPERAKELVDLTDQPT